VSTRSPSAPPDISGFTFDRYLGGGGFADVFLYDQQRPRRKVAVKVLLREMLSVAAQSAFDDEADLMAQLSSHPSIVTIYQVDRASDGRPFLAMQYCPGVNLGRRYRKEPLGVPFALRTGVEIASAVETAHRAGILHRDIKPHNILVTEYNEPLLTDFGIASTLDRSDAAVEGMSVPWSPPESFADPPSASVATDVWGLGATVYTLLAGRSPFEVPGGPNRSTDLITRIETGRPLRTGRPDVPESLERVLATALGRTPEQRYPTALAFARALQRVQDELGLGATTISVQDDLADRGVQAETTEDDPGTRIRPIQIINPHAPENPDAHATSRTTTDPTDPDTPTRVLSAAVGSETTVASAPTSAVPGADPPSVADEYVDVEATERRARPVAEAVVPEASETGPRGAEREDRPSRTRGLALVGGFVAAGAVLAGALLLGGSHRPAPADQPVAAPQDNLAVAVPSPIEVRGEAVGSQVVFTWTSPDPEPDDTYLWRVLSLTESTGFARVAEPTVTVAASDGQTCIEVYLVRHSKASIESTRGCA
jgi:eukaryotic-like serine/threonine-protein kinase